MCGVCMCAHVCGCAYQWKNIPRPQIDAGPSSSITPNKCDFVRQGFSVLLELTTAQRIPEFYLSLLQSTRMYVHVLVYVCRVLTPEVVLFLKRFFRLKQKVTKT